MALFTTIPTSIISPIKLVMEIDMPVRDNAKKAPVIEKGTDSITTKEKRQDSNWKAMTTKTRKIEMAKAFPMAPNSDSIRRILLPCEMETPSKFIAWACAISCWESWLAETPDAVCPVTVTT